MRHVTRFRVWHINDPCQTYEQVMSYIWTSHVAHTTGLNMSHIWTNLYMSHIWTNHVTHIWTNHVTHMNESFYTHMAAEERRSRMSKDSSHFTSHVTQNPSHITSHVNQTSHVTQNPSHITSHVNQNLSHITSHVNQNPYPSFHRPTHEFSGSQLQIFLVWSYSVGLKLHHPSWLLHDFNPELVL